MIKANNSWDWFASLRFAHLWGFEVLFQEWSSSVPYPRIISFVSQISLCKRPAMGLLEPATSVQPSLVHLESIGGIYCLEKLEEWVIWCEGQCFSDCGHIETSVWSTCADILAWNFWFVPPLGLHKSLRADAIRNSWEAAWTLYSISIRWERRGCADQGVVSSTELNQPRTDVCSKL